YEPSPYEKAALGIAEDSDAVFYVTRGCKNCNQTGFKGRTGIFEIMVPNDNVRELIVNMSAASTIRKTAHEAGMKTLQEVGMEKVLQGVTTIAEVLRVTGEQIF
ncbi:MAG: type II secretion system protein GspE, partial [Planctomycetota bacterium]